MQLTTVTEYEIRAASARGLALHSEMENFLHSVVLPAEAEYYGARQADPGHRLPDVIERLKGEARARGLWNLFLPAVSGISLLDYAPIAELSGWSLDLAPEAINGQAPDSGNMELLHLLGSPEQQTRWLDPLLAGEIRSAFAMTEPDVASSDATNISTKIEQDGDEFVVTGRKWWTSGALDKRCQLFIVLGRSNPEAPAHEQHSLLLVPRDAPGLEIVRDLPIFGHHHQAGHAEITLDRVRVPRSALLGTLGGAFAAAQQRLAAGRLHHCLRAIGAGDRALSMMVARARGRQAFGSRLSDQGVVQQQIAESRIELEQARLLCRRACHVVDSQGSRAARKLVSMAKVAVPNAVLRVIDRAIQIHGGAGVSDVTPLAAMYGWHRAMRIFDGPDEVHLRTVARAEIRAAETASQRIPANLGLASAEQVQIAGGQ
jgi:acyl-CoA dehydrogenase